MRQDFEILERNVGQSSNQHRSIQAHWKFSSANIREKRDNYHEYDLCPNQSVFFEAHGHANDFTRQKEK